MSELIDAVKKVLNNLPEQDIETKIITFFQDLDEAGLYLLMGKHDTTDLPNGRKIDWWQEALNLHYQNEQLRNYLKGNMGKSNADLLRKAAELIDARYQSGEIDKQIPKSLRQTAHMFDQITNIDYPSPITRTSSYTVAPIRPEDPRFVLSLQASGALEDVH